MGPLYAQMRDALRRQIEERTFPPGAPMPTEEELQTTYGVSRSVVRQALAELADLGLITRQRGRGSVVTPDPQHHRRANQAGGLRQQLASAGQTLTTRILTLEAVRTPAAAAVQLGTESAWYLERLRSVDDSPVVYMRTWIPAGLFPGLSQESLGGGSLLEWMRATGIPPQGGPRQIEAVAADPTVARYLECPLGTPVLNLRGITEDAQGRCLEWFSAWHRPSTVFDIDAQVDDTSGNAPGAAELRRVRELLGEAERLLQPYD